MADRITYPDKTTGDIHYATEATETKDVVNSHADDIEAITGVPSNQQLIAPTILEVLPESGQVTINFENPNSYVEDNTQVQYKLDTEPTTWTDGLTVAQGGTSVTQTGLTDGLLYNFRLVANGSGAYIDSNPSAVVSQTPVTIVFNNTHSMVVDGTGDAVQVIDNNIYPSAGSGVDLPFSIEMWFQPPTPLTSGHLLRCLNDAQQVIRIIPTNVGVDDHLSLALSTNDTNTIIKKFTQAIVGRNGLWTQIVVTYDGSKTSSGVKMYVNATEKTVFTDDSTGTYTGLADIGTTFTINVPRATTTTATGKYNLFRFFDKVLIASEVTTLYNSGVPISVATVGLTSNCTLELPFNNNADASIGTDGTIQGTPTFDTDLPT